MKCRKNVMPQQNGIPYRFQSEPIHMETAYLNELQPLISNLSPAQTDFFRSFQNRIFIQKENLAFLTEMSVLSSH